MNHSSVTPLPIHFKTLGRSYSQIGRKGNVALYAVYSDYWNDRTSSLPYVLLGFELVAIKTKNGQELYPADWQFGKNAWSIPKSFFRVCYARIRRCASRLEKLRRTLPSTVPYRSPLTSECAHLA